MNIKNELLKDRNKFKINEVAKYVKLNNSKLIDLVSLLKTKDDFLQYRVSWCLSTCYDLKVPNISLHCEVLMNTLLSSSSSSVKRNLLRVLQWIDIPEKHHGNLINSCFSFVDDINEPVAVKAFSLGILEKMCGFYPDLKKELLLVCENHRNTKSAGIKSRINRIYKFLG